MNPAMDGNDTRLPARPRGDGAGGSLAVALVVLLLLVGTPAGAVAAFGPSPTAAVAADGARVRSQHGLRAPVQSGCIARGAGENRRAAPPPTQRSLLARGLPMPRAPCC